MRTLEKIRLIEEPKSEDLLRNELEEALGGWNCGTYDVNSGHCSPYDDGFCASGGTATNYCSDYVGKPEK